MLASGALVVLMGPEASHTDLTAGTWQPAATALCLLFTCRSSRLPLAYHLLTVFQAGEKEAILPSPGLSATAATLYWSKPRTSSRTTMWVGNGPLCLSTGTAKSLWLFAMHHVVCVSQRVFPKYLILFYLVFISKNIR